ncbi:phosphoglycerate mutase-like protein 1 [Tanacetum coccineum]
MIEARLEDLKNKFSSKPTSVDYDRDSKILGGLDPFDVLVLCCKMQILSHNSCSEGRSGELRNSSLFGMGPNDSRSGESGYCCCWCCCFGMGQNVSGTLGTFTQLMRDAIRVRYTLLLYFYTLFRETNVTRVPLALPLWMEFPEYGVHPCDRRSVSEYECLFPAVDFSLASIENDEGVLWKADVRETKEELTSRGKKFLDWIGYEYLIGAAIGRIDTPVGRILNTPELAHVLVLIVHIS